MALVKFFRGLSSDIENVPHEDGYIYFAEDTGKIYIDTRSDSADGSPGTRVTINAHSADVLTNVASGQEIDVDDIFLKNMTASVAQGGTGKGNLTANALLVGNGTGPVKLVSIANNSILLGDSTNGVKGFAGEANNALYLNNSAAPTAGVLPVNCGGTGSRNAIAARENLDVMSRLEVIEQVDYATSTSFRAQIYSSGWQSISEGEFQYELTVDELTCGSDGTVPPIIACTVNKEEYDYIEKAEVPDGGGTTITFTASQAPANDIEVIIIDVK